MEQTTTRQAGRRLLRTIAIILAILLVFAIAVQATEIDLAKPLNPDRQENFIRVLRLLADPDFTDTDQDTGKVVPSESLNITIERIIETILMALLASTAGTILAVPVSFVAARNLMENITAPLASIMAAILSAAIIGAIVLVTTTWLVGLAASIVENRIIGIAIFGVLLIGLWFFIIRTGNGLDDERIGIGRNRILRLIRTVILAGLILFTLALLGQLGVILGSWLEDLLGPLGFLGGMVFVLSDMLRFFLPGASAVILGLVAVAYGSRFAQEAVIRWAELPSRLLTVVLSVAGAFIIIFTIGAFLNWLYEFGDPLLWAVIPGSVAGVLVGIVGLIIKPNHPLRVGSVIYFISRSILNILRSIEPLIMAIVFVVWVSIGPFAGILALTLHSIAALGKLFSEQIEGIDEGPVEAITATGANSLQRIVFAVIPQIVPPFTAFALYRWDINVRLSTIIGFVGGGGIGFVLYQNTQRLRYREASVMMLAIAIVVATLDYASSKIRSRII